MNNTIKIKKVAVLGAGVMGAQIAAHLANAGVSVGMTSARGENDLAKGTADGVREPLNRRVEVTVQ